MIPRAAGIKSYEELLESSEGALEEGNENQEGSKSMLLIKAYVARRSISWIYQTAKGDTMNNELVEHKDESPSMIDKVTRTSQRREAIKVQIVCSSDKVEGATRLKQHTQDHSTKRKKTEGHQNP